MKIQKGMYVRFKDKRGVQYIRKITSINTEKLDRRYAAIYIDKDANNCNGVGLKNIVGEPTFNLIDLIKQGDYVNGYPAVAVMYICDTKTKRKINRTVWIDKPCAGIKNGLTPLLNGGIKNVVTKEQFEKCKYIIGDDNNGKIKEKGKES